MKFEFDPGKSDINLKKHGIDFNGAQRLWDDPELIEISAMTEIENRWLVIGRIEGRHWSAVITFREEAVRLISVRRSRFEEVELYESGRIG